MAESLAYKKIDQFRNKAGAWQSQAKAEQIKLELQPLLAGDDCYKLTTAHNHYLLGEGAAELYDVCKELMLKYSK